MKNLRQHLHRSGRSNMYSRSKFSNWGTFNPYFAEFRSRLHDAKRVEINIAEKLTVKVFEHPLHEDFVRPVTIKDIEATLKSIPEQFVRCIRQVALLGGTKKQDKTAFNMFYYGLHYCGSVALCAFPKKFLKQYYNNEPPPLAKQEYERVHAKIYQEGPSWVLELNEKSLKEFYLRDVLIHEIGHAVEFTKRPAGTNLTEEFAEWFVREYGFRYQTR